MLKSILLAGVLLVTSNFNPSSTLTSTKASAFEISPAANVLKAIPFGSSAVAPVLAAFNDNHEKPATFRSVNPGDVQPNVLASPQEQQFMDLINGERASRGLNILSSDPLLIAVARTHSKEMCDQGYFDHHSPTPGLRTPMDRFLNGLREVGDSVPNYVLVGENIYYCSETNDEYNVEYGHRALMNSPGHRANILESRFGKIGVGVYTDDQGEIWVTEMFLNGPNA